ncbi:MAG: trypsin-like peptidase domain-containing protein [Deltaproteobacteria bacterium]|nr:trypsin-like peptidase domain-containing protein [Deltaproteobacteria bacterium]
MLTLAYVFFLSCASVPGDATTTSLASGAASTSVRRTPVVEVVQRAGASVVNISTEVAVSSNPFSRWGQDGALDFFGQRKPRAQQSLGSGVIIDASGLVLTNEHVIQRAANITITLADRRRFDADVVGADPTFDVAVLKIRDGAGRVQAEGLALPVATFGTSTDIMIGETVVAIGNPFGLANTVTTGVVSALHRSIEAEDKSYEDFIQTDAAINPGNSGGALLNLEGRLIGINTAIYSGGTGIGFAIPVDKAKAVVDEVLRYGEVRPAFTGIMLDHKKLESARVARVIPGSPAELAGVLTNDEIVDVSGIEVDNARAYRLLERSFVPGQRVRLTAVRGGKKTRLELVVKELSAKMAATIGRSRLGLSVTEKGGRLVITGVRAGSHAASLGIRKGDLLLSIGGRRLARLEHFEAIAPALYDAEAVSVIIGRLGRAYYVTLELDSAL